MNLSKKITFLISTVFLFQFCFIKADPKWVKLGNKQFKTISKTRSIERSITAISLDGFAYEWAERQHKWIKLGNKQFETLSFPWALDLNKHLYLWNSSNWGVVLGNTQFKTIYYPMALDVNGHVHFYEGISQINSPITFSDIFSSIITNNYLALDKDGYPYRLTGGSLWIKSSNTVPFKKIFDMAFGLGEDNKIYRIHNPVLGGCEQIVQGEFQDLWQGQRNIWLLSFDNIIYKLYENELIRTSDNLFVAVFDDLALGLDGCVYEWREGEGKKPCLLL